MNISQKSIKIIYWLATLNIFVGILLVTLLKPVHYTWQAGVVITVFYIVILSMYFYVIKIFRPIIQAHASTKPRFDTRIKSQLWGVLIRLISGVAGIGTVAILLQLSFSTYAFAAVIFLGVVVAGFINDGKHFDQFQRGAVYNKSLNTDASDADTG